MPFGGIVLNMESRLKFTGTSGISAILIAAVLWLSVTSVYAETYRWKDKDGKVHYGAVVPAEYANQPYDVLNNAGMVIDHVEDTSVPEEIRAEKKVQDRVPLISQEERARQADRLLVIQYRSEEEIHQALELEIAQLGYDTRVINQSYESANLAIKDQIRQAAEQQRANMPISEDQKKGIDKLYVRRASDERKRAAMQSRENKIRARYARDLERYRYLTSPEEDGDEEAREQK
jgi:hypothetical protein